MNQEVPVSVMNKRILEDLANGEVKRAQAATSEMTRTQLREDSFTGKIQPFELATDDMLVPSLTHDKPQVYWELEPDSPGAAWVPFQTVPEGEYMFGSRYVIPFARIVTKKYEKDIDELRTYKTDIRRVLTENSVKDGGREIDSKYIGLVNAIVTGDGAGALSTGVNGFEFEYVQPVTGKIQWAGSSTPLSREGLADAKKMLIKTSTFAGLNDKFALRNYICLMNDVTAQDLLKFDRTEAGGDLSETMLKDGLVLDKIMGIKTVYTLKQSLIPDNTLYFFAAPEFLGKAFYLTDWTMFMKKEAFFIEMFSYWLGGMAIGNIAACARFDFSVDET